MNILKEVINNVNGISVSELLEKHSIAQRTLYYDFEKINDWLSLYNFGKLHIENHIIFARINNFAEFDKFVKKQTLNFWAPDDRIALIILVMLLSDENITINKLIETFDVSKNTVLADITKIKSQLKQRELCLKTTTKTGYQITGNETLIRKLIWEKIQQLSTPTGIEKIHSILQKTLVRLTSNDVDYNEICRCLIQQHEKDLNTQYFLYDNDVESMMIQIAWIRSLKNCKINLSDEEKQTLLNTPSYYFVKKNIQKLQVHFDSFFEDEILYITGLVLGIQSTEYLLGIKENGFISNIVKLLATSFERIACVNFTSKEKICQKLEQHIRPMYYRYKFGMLNKNPLVKDIKRMYQKVFYFTQKAVQETGIFNLPDDEIAYITVYFASELNPNLLAKGERDDEQVLIVNAENMAIATLVQEQLKKLFGLSFEYNTTNLKKIKSHHLSDYALVVSLVPNSAKVLKNCDNLVETGPILVETAQRRIIDILKRSRTVSRYHNTIEDIINVVKRNLSDTQKTQLKEEMLYFDLFCMLDDKTRAFGVKTVEQTYLQRFNKEQIVLLSEESDWKQALELGATRLQQGQSANALVERVNNLVGSNKLQYYRICSGALLVHLPMQGDKNGRIDMQVLFAKNPIMGPDNIQTNIVICVSTINRHSHWGMLYEIYNYFENEEYVNGLIDMYS